MKFIRDGIDKWKELSAAAPIDCPRGWGSVAFHVTGAGMLPFVSVERACPIGGVPSCAACRHPPNPERVERLRAILAELESLRRDGTLTGAEFEAQRAALLEVGAVRRPGEGLAIAAWMLAPTGLFVGAVGAWLVGRVHEGFLALAAAGGLLAVVGLGLAMAAAHVRRAPRGDVGPHRA
ncbi:MAG: hypothetical protein ACF8XB_01950 [Planctomycetota bacterium JB042]